MVPFIPIPLRQNGYKPLGYANSNPNGKNISLDDFGQNYEENGEKFEPTKI